MFSGCFKVLNRYKKMCIIFCCLIIVACSSDDSTDLSGKVVALEYSVKEKFESNNPVYTQKYAFDDEGKVISEHFTSFYNPQYSYISVFEYNSDGQVITEIRNKQVYKYILWENDVAEVFNSQDQKIAQFTFSEEQLTTYITEIDSDYQTLRKLDYDKNGNVISMGNGTEISVEYLNYDTTKQYPLNLIKSIGILRMDYKPFFKNIFAVEKVYPFEGDDFTSPLRLYDYQYTFDADHRVFQIEDTKSAIYTSQFVYEY